MEIDKDEMNRVCDICYKNGLKDLRNALADSKFIRFNYGVTSEHLASILRDFSAEAIVRDWKEYCDEK